MSRAGFTLVELLVVLVIVSILATQVVVLFTSANGKVKSVAYNMRGHLNLARAEAVGRNHNVLIEFIFADPNGDGDTSDGIDIDGDGDKDDGYSICLDKNSDNDCDDAGEGTIPGIPTAGVALPDGVRFYYVSAVDGPCKEPTATGPCAALTPGDGVSFTGNKFAMRSRGTSNKGGTVYFYAPENDDHTQLKAGPYAMVVTTSGRLRLERWDKHKKLWSPNFNGCGACP